MQINATPSFHLYKLTGTFLGIYSIQSPNPVKNKTLRLTLYFMKGYLT